MLETIIKHLDILGIKIKGSINLEIDLIDKNVIKIYDMNISTFQKKHIATYYKNIDTTFPIE